MGKRVFTAKFSAVAIAARTVAELLESRRLLSGITPSLLQASVPHGVMASLTALGAAELSIAPGATGTGVFTPDYVELESKPQICPRGIWLRLQPPDPPG